VTPIGRRQWAIAAGHAPSVSTGEEPEFTSRDELSLLNASDELANVRLHVLYATRGEIGPFRLGVAPRRLRRVRINDLIFPEAVRLDEPYSLLVRSDVPVVVQFTRQDTRAPANTGLLATAWPDDDATMTVAPAP
jgi:hypothetical protein